MADNQHSKNTSNEMTRDEVKDMIKEKLEQPSASVPPTTETNRVTDESLDINTIRQKENEPDVHTLENESHEKSPHEDIYDDDALQEQVDTGEISTEEETVMQGYEEEAKKQMEKDYDSI